MPLGDAALIRLQALDDLLHVLRRIMVGDEHGIVGLDDDQVADPDTGDQPPFGNGQGVAAGFEHDITA